MAAAVPLIGLALAAAGTGVGVAASQQERSNMNKAMDAELARQSGFRKQAKGIFDTSLAQSGPAVAKQQMGAGAQNFAQQQAKAAAVPLGGDVVSPIAVNDPTIAKNVQDYVAPRQAGAAQLSGLDQWSLDQAIKNTLANANLGVVSGQARNSESVLPYEIQAAQHSRDDLSGIGSLMSTVGSLASVYGAGAGGLSGLFAKKPTPPSYWQSGMVSPEVDPYGLNQLTQNAQLGP